MRAFLHLSDLHYGKWHHYDQGVDTDAATLADAVADAVRSHLAERRIDALILTGDFFCDDLPSDKAKATDGLASLVRALDISPDRVLSLPGNHDLSWDPNFQHQRFRFYDEMVRDAGIKGFKCRDLPALFVLPAGPEDRKGVAFLLLNSCVMEGKETAGFGRVGDNQLAAASDALRKANVRSETHVLIAALHHHLVPVVPLVRNWKGPDPREGKVELTSLTVDAVAVLQRLSELGFSMAIHGHQHHPAVCRFEDVLSEHQPIGVCAAGSCAANDAIRQFFLYEVEEAQTIVWAFEQSRHNESRFVRRNEPLLLPNVAPLGQSIHNLQSSLLNGGIEAVYPNRGGSSEKALQDAFRAHTNGEVRLTGASLRLFLAPGLHFYYYVQELLQRQSAGSISVRAVMCSPDYNRELPVRSFIEEFGPNGEHPRVHPLNWAQPLTFDFAEFEATFFAQHGAVSRTGKTLRVIHDLQSTRVGIEALRGVAQGAANQITHRETRYAPYCTAVIFPDRAFYTPNLLCATVPVDLPMMVFEAGSDAYEKLAEYFEFQWWLGGIGGSTQPAPY
jgi:UDP-2,3-diacylglucosamine pyrophosphatase LpxH